MSDTMNVERLTPLDMIMPRTYIGALLTFSTTEPISSISPNFQRGLDGLLKQLPWLSGQVFPTTPAAGEAPGLEIRWDVNAPAPTIVDKGSIKEAFETLSAQGMPPSAIPADVWPVPAMIDEDLFAKGAPVFGASLFRFADNRGVGLCISIHHNTVDAAGFTEIVRLWAQSIAGSVSSSSILGLGRISQLSGALSSDLSAVSSQSIDSLFASHPDKCMPKAPTTNTVVSALVWSAITRARLQRNPGLADETSRLAMAVNGRRRIGEEFSSPETPYIANNILYSLAKLSVEDLKASGGDNAEQLSKLCDIIAQSQSSTLVNSRHIAEVYSMANGMEDYRTMFVGWDLFGSRDLTITSWADLDLYEMSFGSELGSPDFIRPPYSEADGVGMVLPRKKVVAGAGASDEVVEVMVMLRRDDMEVLEKHGMWKA
ncbi:hypothetical protein BGZ61DRAFT_428239 [Ilyonectria robusta]|uniref:uncharacterized protein n=1 Tax=Ilyonectria robusta TaxID=1079257 RepID=UPI001E8CA3C4|nr:uncharacterized protein BGZ61DRAFT_428239 [Ilyonectria robusta]KAH8672395.1 hypothetical protein BGZ61DRAFT_428239 [Ilyonectria robusta]